MVSRFHGEHAETGRCAQASGRFLLPRPPGFESSSGGDAGYCQRRQTPSGQIVDGPVPGKPIRFHSVPGDEYKAQLIRFGASEAYPAQGYGGDAGAPRSQRWSWKSGTPSVGSRSKVVPNGVRESRTSISKRGRCIFRDGGDLLAEIDHVTAAVDRGAQIPNLPGLRSEFAELACTSGTRKVAGLTSCSSVTTVAIPEVRRLSEEGRLTMKIARRSAQARYSSQVPGRIPGTNWTWRQASTHLRRGF